MKSFLSAGLLLVLLLGALPLQAWAAAGGGTDVTLKLASQSDGQIAFEVNALNSANLLGAQATVHYDPGKLRLHDAGIAAKAPFTAVGRTDAPGAVAVALINKSPTDQPVASLAMMTVTFDILAEGGTKVWLTGIKAVNQDYAEIQSGSDTAPLAVQLTKTDNPGTDPDTGPDTGPGTDPGTGPGTDPGSGPGSGTGSGPNSGSGGNSASGSGSQASGSNSQHVIAKEDLIVKDGNVLIALPPDNEDSILLSVDAAQSLKDLSLTLTSGSASITYDGRVLQDLLALAKGRGLDGAYVEISFLPVPADETDDMTSMSGEGAEFKLESRIYRLDLKLVAGDGTSYRLNSFKWLVTLTLPLGTADAGLAGLYTYDSRTNQWIYVGGKAADKSITTPLVHFSDYAVWTYRKTFNDVAASAWYAGAVQHLAARHIAEGVDAVHFMPNGSVTRAQFTALLARTLQLKAAGSSPFTDVKPNAWYADAVAAAHEAGLIGGTDASTFSPDMPVTREQMAVILARTAQQLHLKAIRPAAQLKAFADTAAIDEWAKEAIVQARAAGLVNGMQNNRFEPKSILTRAQAAAALDNLLLLMEAAK